MHILTGSGSFVSSNKKTGGGGTQQIPLSDSKSSELQLTIYLSESVTSPTICFPNFMFFYQYTWVLTISPPAKSLSIIYFGRVGEDIAITIKLML